MKLKSLLTAIVITTGLFFATPLLAVTQPGGPGGDPDAEIPIDGGIGLLIAAGVAYGAKKAYDKRKKEEDK
jgi:hypothetical protein